MSDGAVNCPHCDGAGGSIAFINRGPDISKHTIEWVQCRTCNGMGAIDADKLERIKAGRRMRDERVAKQQTLRDAARELGISPSELSAREMGRNE